jgi:hypothetical protein
MKRYNIVMPESFMFMLAKAASRRGSKDKPGKKMSRSELIRRILHKFLLMEAERLTKELGKGE